MLKLSKRIDEVGKMTTATRLMTAEEFLMMPDDGRRYELVRGELVELPQPGMVHGFVSMRIGRILDIFVEEHGLGIVVTPAGFVIEIGPDTVRAPDVAFISFDRLPEGDLPTGFLDTTPNIVVEVLSPTDRQGAVNAKIRLWLDKGAELVWVLHPPTKTVRVCRPNAEDATLTAGDVLDAEPVLPGFSAPVADLFRQPTRR